MDDLALRLLFFCAAYMTGVIWFVQLVHYPMLHHADGVEREQGHAEYARRMGWVVGPVMIGEAGIQVLLLARSPSGLMVVASALLAVIWLSTFLLQVPLHQKLISAFDPALQRRLVLGNWIRTVAWTLRAFLLGLALA